MVVPKSPLRGFTYGDSGAQIPRGGILLRGLRVSNPKGGDSRVGIPRVGTPRVGIPRGGISTGPLRIPNPQGVDFKRGSPGLNPQGVEMLLLRFKWWQVPFISYPLLEFYLLF